jgi:L-histidine Nalpha-methyltransferase
MRPFAASAPEHVTAVAGVAADARAGLTASPKTLPPRLLYDTTGSALFEAICQLPWYGITRAETALLEHVAWDIARRLPAVSDVVELGPGSGDKLARLLAPFARRAIPMTAHLVDVSSDALDAAEQSLGRVPRLRVVRHHATFDEGLEAAARVPRTGGRLVAFLGSNIGNFDPDQAAALLEAIARSLGPGDGLLLGADLVKPEPALLAAYDDPLGVTAAFNRNLLVRLNRELGANFDVGAFNHEARWNGEASRVEMHLVSRRPQEVSLPGAGLSVTFARLESIWTESSYKYEPDQLVALGRSAGFHLIDQWIDANARFALTLFTR